MLSLHIPTSTTLILLFSKRRFLLRGSSLPSRMISASRFNRSTTASAVAWSAVPLLGSPFMLCAKSRRTTVKYKVVFLRTFFVIGAPNVVFLQGRVNVRSGKPNLSEPNVSKENMFCSGVFAVAGIGRDCRLGFRSVRGRTNWAAYTHTHTPQVQSVWRSSTSCR